MCYCNEEREKVGQGVALCLVWTLLHLGVSSVEGEREEQMERWGEKRKRETDGVNERDIFQPVYSSSSAMAG